MGMELHPQPLRPTFESDLQFPCQLGQVLQRSLLLHVLPVLAE
jgi:hypothetical protein